MGLSIHYNGYLRSKESLPSLIEEVKDIAKIYLWPYEIYETEFPLRTFGRKRLNNNLYGIRFTPPECETISLCFLSNGKLICFWSWLLYIKSLGTDKNYLEGGVSVKTHYAGEVIHEIVILLLDYLSKKYFRHFNMIDEGQYWETRDEKLLHQNFSRLSGFMNTFGNTLEANPIKLNESLEKYFERLLAAIHKKS